MRIVFMGTPDLAATVMSNIADHHDVVGAYTRPDAVRGRGKRLVASPVKQLAEERGIPAFTAATLRDEEVLENLRALEPDAICVVAYGSILPTSILELPRYGCFNVHTSLLPRWRGAAPMQRAILAGDKTTGVSIMRMEEGLDTGAYCKRAEVPLDGVYLADLESDLAACGSELLLEALEEVQDGSLTWTEQPEAGVTYAAKIGKGELDLDPSESAGSVCAKVRASDDAHPAHMELAQRKVTLERAHEVDDDLAKELCEALAPGEAVFRSKRLIARASVGAFEIDALKPQGKKSMDARSFAAGIQGVKNATLRWGRA